MKSEHDQRTTPPAHATGTVEFLSLADVADDESFRLRAPGDVSQLATSIGRLGQLAPIELRPWPAAALDGPCWQVVSGFRRLAAVRMLARERVLARIHFELPDRDAWGLAIGEALLNEPLTGEELQALRERLRASGVAPWAEELVDEAMVRAPVSPELRERFHEFLTATPAPPTTAQIVTGPDANSPESVVAALPRAPEPPVTPSVRVDAPEPQPMAIVGAGGAEQPLIPSADADAPAQPLIPSVGANAPESRDEPPPFPDEIVEVTPEELIQDLTTRLYALNQDLMTAFEAWEDLPVDGRKLLVEQARYVAALLPFMEAKQ